MIKTLLAGALLSTGLLAGGAVGAEDMKMDNLKSNENNPNQSITMSADGTTSYSDIHNAPKDGVPATPKGDVNMELNSNEDSSTYSITTSADGTTSYSDIHDAPKDGVPATSKEDVK
ncbi:hypothetical protein P9Z94_29240 [Bacillus thuringiensis]|uniref:hypothetical protein n=1 Tax=Bacillus thuringiensis TaxID=1428 RepID=UPI002DBB844F|nr:hypothetical protein [Bacillus thuringiensis]MEC3160092.1 hypothetical protein [Bacillus thuringiensis]